MEPRPILLVKHIEGVVPMSRDIEGMLAKEGYLVLRCDDAQFDTLKVLAPSSDLLIAALAASCHEHFGALPGDWDQIIERHTSSPRA